MDPKIPGKPQVTPHDPEETGSRRDPEERHAVHEHEVRSKMLDKTLADSFLRAILPRQYLIQAVMMPSARRKLQRTS